MPRLARIVVPGYPHHVIQRGNRRQATFFQTADYRLYLQILREQCTRFNVDVWAYCLMPNHVHLVVVPTDGEALSKTIGTTHRRYTVAINERMEWRGYLWQGRFASFPMDHNYLLAAVRYVEMNPVKAHLVDTPEAYPWSSARYHLKLGEDPNVAGSPLRDLVDNWRDFLTLQENEAETRRIRVACNTGNPLGTNRFLSDIERQLGQCLPR